MIFGRSKPSEPAAPQIQWPIVGSKYQTVTVKLDRYRYFAVGSNGHWGADLEGSSEVMPDSRVLVNLQVLDPLEPPPSIEGTCSYVDLGPAAIPLFDARIFCQRGAVASILPILQCFGAPGIGIWLKLEIVAPPGEQDAQFWRTAWREKKLQVRFWRFDVEGGRGAAR